MTFDSFCFASLSIVMGVMPANHMPSEAYRPNPAVLSVFQREKERSSHCISGKRLCRCCWEFDMFTSYLNDRLSYPACSRARGNTPASAKRKTEREKMWNRFSCYFLLYLCCHGNMVRFHHPPRANVIVVCFSKLESTFSISHSHGASKSHILYIKQATY